MRGTGARGRRVLLVAALMASVAVTVVPTVSPSAGTGDRTLKLYNTHTGERAAITYMRNGRLDPAGVKQLNHFLRDWRRDQATRMDPRLFDVLWQAYQETGSNDYIHVISGYRSPATNEMLRRRSRGVAKNSQHTYGRATDFFLPDVPLSKLREVGLKMQAGGVGFYPTSGSPFVHLDVGSVRHWPRMTRQQLVRVFPNGGTLHVPSDGKPLPGYDRALAAYKARQSSGRIAIASLTPSVEEDDIENAVPATAVPSIVVSGGPGIVADDQALLPRRRPGSEAAPIAAPVQNPAFVTAWSAPATQPADAALLAAADIPLPRPAPVTTRSFVEEPAAVAAMTPPMEPVQVSAAPAMPETATPTPTGFEARTLAFAEATGYAMPLPRPAPVTTRANIADVDAPPALDRPAPRPARIVASLNRGAADTVNMAEARARAIAAIRAQLLRREASPEPNPIGSAVMAFAPATTPGLRSEPAADFAMITGAVPLPRSRPMPMTVAAIAEPQFAEPQFAAPAAPQPHAVTPPASNPLALLSPATGGATEVAVLTQPGSTRQSHFASLDTYGAGNMPELLLKPDRAIAITFTAFVYDGLRTDRFAGRTVAPLTTINLNRTDGYFVTAQR